MARDNFSSVNKVKIILTDQDTTLRIIIKFIEKYEK